MKKILSLILLSLFFFSLSVPAFAGTGEMEVTLAKDYENCAFHIKWENTEKEASARLTSPDGKTYDGKGTDGNLYIYVGTAKAGTWKATVTGNQLGKVTLTGGNLPGSMTIQEFSITYENGNFHTKWNVADCPDNITLEIFADTDDSGFDGTLLTSFQDRPSGEKSFTSNSVATGDYHFYLRVSQGSNGIFSQEYGKDVLYLSPSNAPEKLSGITAGMIDDDLNLSWDAGDYKKFKVMVYDPESKNLIWSEEVENRNYYSWMIPEDYKKDTLLAAVAGMEQDRIGQYDKLEVKTKNPIDASVSFPEGSVLNQKFILAEVTLGGDYQIFASLNGNMLLEGETQGGQYRVDMEDGQNKILFQVKDKLGNTKTFYKELTVDTAPPQLAVKNNIQNLRTSQSHLYLTGYSEQGATLTLNGEKKEMINGYFNIKCDLSPGKNSLKLVSTDAAGNESVYTAEVTQIPGGNILYWIIGGIVVVLLIVIYVIIFVRGIRRKKRNENA